MFSCSRREIRSAEMQSDDKTMPINLCFLLLGRLLHVHGGVESQGPGRHRHPRDPAELPDRSQGEEPPLCVCVGGEVHVCVQAVRGECRTSHRRPFLRSSWETQLPSACFMQVLDKPSDRMRVLVPHLQKCLTMWYHMFGRNIGALVVSIGTLNNKVEKWRQTGALTHSRVLTAHAHFVQAGVAGRSVCVFQARRAAAETRTSGSRRR